MILWGSRRRRVAHLVDVCFNCTQTFIYDFICGCRTFEAYSLAQKIVAQPGLEFERVYLTSTDWEHRTLWGLVDRACFRLFGEDRLPYYRALFRVRPAVLHAHFGITGYEA